MKSRSQRSPTRRANDPFLDFTSSVHFDHRLWRHDIAGSIAHAHALRDASIITSDELKSIVRGLRGIAKDLSTGGLLLDPALEDLHMNVERTLTARIGDAGAKLHTARSRNDQVALDARLAVREFITEVMAVTLLLQETILEKARDASGAVMPGYTHLQHAQPVLVSHHLLAHFWRLERDITRLTGCYKRTNVSPLGSGALAGVTFKLNRQIVSNLLAMDGTTSNSIDAVSDRDFVAEFVFCLSMLMIHLSSMSEELILWSSTEFSFLKLPRHLLGGSSMMPQKSNPDIPELVRGKSASTIGNLVAVLTLMKSLPLAYNRDLQEDKENLFDAFDAAEASLRALTSFLAEAEFDKVRMRKAAEVGLMTATDLADFLTTRGVPFREAHGTVRKLAEQSEGDDSKFMDLAKKLMVNTMDCSTSEVNILSVDRAIARRNVSGGTSKRAVAIQMTEACQAVAENRKLLAAMNKQVAAVDRMLS